MQVKIMRPDGYSLLRFKAKEELPSREEDDGWETLTNAIIGHDEVYAPGCDHQCSGNCRREGCNCECGEWHGKYEESD